MLRLGAVLAIFGFGSALLHFTEIQFRLLRWAADWQPWFGLAIGGVGALLLLIATLRGTNDATPAPRAAYGPPSTGPQPGYGTPPAGFGMPPAGAGTPPAGYGPPQGYPPPIPQQGPQYGPRPPMGPPLPRGPVQDFGPQGGPPFGPQGR